MIGIKNNIIGTNANANANVNVNANAYEFSYQLTCPS